MEFGDASATIERYREALKHILLMLVGMAEMGSAGRCPWCLGKPPSLEVPGRALDDLPG